MEQFNFDAPQFCDFLNLDDSADDVESYFDIVGVDGLPEHVIYINDYEPESASESSVTNSISSQIDNLTINGDFDHTLNRKTKRVPSRRTDKTRTKRRSRSLQSFESRFTSYVSMAEAVHKFHFKTPKRFHSRLSKSDTTLNKISKCLGPTVALSPCLRTKMRSRPTVVLSQEERELQELQNRVQIKAQPLNRAIFIGPTKPSHVLKKSTTEPKPFNLTQMPAKKPSTSTDTPVHQFRARPVPKSVKQKLKSTTTIRPPKTPRSTPSVAIASSRRAPTPAVLKPFSFLERDQNKKPTRPTIETPKHWEFRAKPLPKMYDLNDKSSIKSSDETLNARHYFKARPAKVLRTQPFRPKTEGKFTEIVEFDLHSEARGKQREAYGKKMAERLEQIDAFREKKEEDRRRQAREEVAKLRKQAEHVAGPIRKYKPVDKVDAKPLTVPVTPKFSRLKHPNKENVSP